MPNPWIDHVKQVQRAGGLTYNEALKEASKTYQKGGEGFRRGENTSKFIHPKIAKAIRNKNFKDLKQAIEEQKGKKKFNAHLIQIPLTKYNFKFLPNLTKARTNLKKYFDKNPQVKEVILSIGYDKDDNGDLDEFEMAEIFSEIIENTPNLDELKKFLRNQIETVLKSMENNQLSEEIFEGIGGMFEGLNKEQILALADEWMKKLPNQKAMNKIFDSLKNSNYWRNLWGKSKVHKADALFATILPANEGEVIYREKIPLQKVVNLIQEIIKSGKFDITQIETALTGKYILQKK